MTPALQDLAARLKGTRGVLVDSNVLLDVATSVAAWSHWSARALAEAVKFSALIINPIVYAEVSIAYSTIEALDAALPSTFYQGQALPWEAGFLAEKCFLLCRWRGGVGASPLPDFYIGAHAAVGRLALLPNVEILAPRKRTAWRFHYKSALYRMCYHSGGLCFGRPQARPSLFESPLINEFTFSF